MKKRIAGILIFLSLIGIGQAFAVSEAAVLFLLISPSPQANGMGQSYGAASAASPMAAIMNPAALGFFAQKNFIGQEYYPEAIVWLPFLTDDLTYDAQTTAFGINLRQFSRIPVSIGIARSKVALDLGTVYQTSESSPEPQGSFSSYENCEGTTLALAADYYIRASFGITWKHIDSHLAPFGAGIEPSDGRASIDAKDWGLMLQLPLIEIGRASGLLAREPVSPFNFWIDPGFYYSKTNIGGKISYIEAAQADPIPRSLSIGLNLQAGVRYRGLTLAGFSWSREVDDMLIERYPDGTSRYLSGAPDLRFYDNVVLGKANPGTIRRRGHEFNFGDIYFLRSGTYEDIEGKTSAGTSGYGINFLQPLRIAAVFLDLDRTWWGRILSRISFEKHHAESEMDDQYPFAITEYDSYIFRLSGFPILN